MMFVAAVRRDQHVRFVAARGDGGGEVRLPRHGGVDLLGLEHRRGGRRVLREDDVLLDVRRDPAAESPDCESRYRSRKCDGVNCVQAILWPFSSSIDLIDDSETMPSPPRDQSCIMIDLRLLIVLGEDRRFARPVVDRVPHDVDVALAERGQLRGRVLDQHELHVHVEALAGTASRRSGFSPSLKTMPGAWPAQVLMATTSGRFELAAAGAADGLRRRSSRRRGRDRPAHS